MKPQSPPNHSFPSAPPSLRIRRKANIFLRRCLLFRSTKYRKNYKRGEENTNKWISSRRLRSRSASFLFWQRMLYCKMQLGIVFRTIRTFILPTTDTLNEIKFSKLQAALSSNFASSHNDFHSKCIPWVRHRRKSRNSRLNEKKKFLCFLD